MSSTTSEKLFAGFPAATDADWRKVAEEALDGAPFEKRLVTRTPEGIDLQPIYSRADGRKLGLSDDWPGLPPYGRGADALGARATGWRICQDLGCVRADDYNAALRHDLDRGQNAVYLALDTATRVGLDPNVAAPAQVADTGLSLASIDDVDAALRGVDLGAVPLFAQAGLAAPAVARWLTQWLVRTGRAAAELHGAVLGDPFAEWLRQGGLPVGLEEVFDGLAKLTTEVQRDGWRLRTIGVDAGQWADAGAQAVQELAFGLATGTAYLRALDERGVGVDVAAPRVLFTFALGSNLFMEIAKLRAARLLWSRALEAAGGGTEARRLVCHGRTTRWNKTVLDPHVNLLRTTSEAFAGVVGGCAGLQVGTYDGCIRAPDEFSRRLARNLQIILAEECQLSRVVDPAGGSWYVETLTRQLAAKAWGLFQDIERRGGMAAALREGYPQSRVEKTAAERIAAVESRRDGVIGTNLHPNLREKPADPAARPPTETPAQVVEGAAPSAPTNGIRRLVPRRRAEPFEALRRRAEAFLARTGARPRVFLAGMGPRKQHAARVDFSSAFFATGGFETVAGRGLDTPEAAARAALASGAPIVVLCSTDDTYPALVPVFAGALKAAAPPPLVVLAGLPATPELQQQFKSAGIDEFIHLRANAARLLAHFQDRLGL
jgi:methylmalonyl-CoA mutase